MVGGPVCGYKGGVSGYVGDGKKGLCIDS
jgi:hypothetical protein